jgi:hypothetical protein
MDDPSRRFAASPVAVELQRTLNAKKQQLPLSIVGLRFDMLSLAFK